MSSRSTTGLCQAEETVGIANGDPETSGLQHVFLAQFAEDPDDNLAHRPDGIGQFLLTDPGDEFGSSLAFGCQIEEIDAPHAGERS